MADLADGDGTEEYHITGLPAAEDRFGVEMFLQMGIAAPLAGLIIFLLMWFFFRSVTLVLSPMIVAMATVIATMGLLIGLGYTVHIMSSMIPIFLMPIAVVDSVHILSEFGRSLSARKEPRTDHPPGDGKPLYSYALHVADVRGRVCFARIPPIPPVQVFGSFVAVGIVLAFLLTITFIPAFVSLMSDARIRKLRPERELQEHHRLARWLTRLGPKTLSAAKAIPWVSLRCWWSASSESRGYRSTTTRCAGSGPATPIRVADRVLNAHFDGTYDAFLVLEYADDQQQHALAQEIGSLLEEAEKKRPLRRMGGTASIDGRRAFRSHLDDLIDAVLTKLDEVEGPEPSTGRVSWACSTGTDRGQVLPASRDPSFHRGPGE